MSGRRWLGDGRYGREVIREDREQVLEICRRHTLRQCTVRSDLTGVDRLAKSHRFLVVYQRRSRTYGVRVVVSVEIGELEARPSIVARYKGADWLERELWDIFGICVSGHPGRRRLLSDYGQEGHPRRKDYPLSGYSEVRYDDVLKRVVREPVERSQRMG